ncbi:DNA mismatch endonuclease Vsr [Candidatus Norongarragalina meridionalis]|nr:DNA mismatch endonuclease Vsr [Candidatus Norongarragalina meridionalis]
MSKIKGKGTKPEKVLKKILNKARIGFRTYADAPGKPDFVLTKKKIAIFVDGKFWHGYRFATWKNKLTPFWLDKITENMRRDKKNDRLLRKMGWEVLRFWDFEIMKNPEKCIGKIKRTLK